MSTGDAPGHECCGHHSILPSSAGTRASSVPSGRLRQNVRVDDLRVLPGPGVPRGVTIPAHELVERFSRSSGPGGQGVNTTDSRVQLSFDIGTTTALHDAQRARLLRRLDSRLAGTMITISAEEHRSQRQNRNAARERLAEMLREALTPEIARRATRPTSGSRRRRLADKHQRSETKAARRRPSAHD